MTQIRSHISRQISEFKKLEAEYQTVADQYPKAQFAADKSQHEVAYARQAMEKLLADIASFKLDELPERFKKPSDEQLIDFALIFAHGVAIDQLYLANMVGMCCLVVDRLHENGDVLMPCRHEISEAGIDIGQQHERAPDFIDGLPDAVLDRIEFLKNKPKTTQSMLISGKSGVALVAAERDRQIQNLGYSYTRDLEINNTGELAMAAAVYALPAKRRKFSTHGKPIHFPWKKDFYKPNPDDRIRELTKAGALIVAEIDRLLILKERENKTTQP